jgi:hypothetical protein
LFTTLNVTLPLGAEVFDSLNLNSVAVTVIDAAFAARWLEAASADPRIAPSR